MKKILLATVLTLILVSCVQQPPPQAGDSIVLSKEEYESLKRSTNPEYPRVLGQFTTHPEHTTDVNYLTQVGVIAIDSCEYVGKLYWGESDFLAHKGNCKFCRERREIQHQRLVDEVVYRLTHKEKDSVQ